MSHCPSCTSSRVRNGYRSTPFFFRLIGIRELLCDDCNYLYRAFSPLPPKHPRRHHSARRADTFAPPPAPEKGRSNVRLDLPKTPNGDHPGNVRYQHSPHRCPFCGSYDTRRRRRRAWERMAFLLSEKRPYLCSECDGSFYAVTRH